MKKQMALMLAFLLLLLCGCAANEQLMRTGQETAQLRAEIADLEQSRGELSRSQTELEAENAALRAELAQAQTDLDAVSRQLYELTCLKPAGEVILFGKPAVALTDEEQLYVDASLLPEGVFEESLCREQDGRCYVPLAAACEQLGLYLGKTPEGVTFAARQKTVKRPETQRAVPILMYHAVGDETWGYQDLFVKPAELEAQLQYLCDNGYQPIWFEDLEHIGDYEKPVILTFDDGYDDNYTNLLPLLKTYQVKATVFVIGNAMAGMQHKMTAEQVKEMADSGLVSIQSHTYTHHTLSSMGEEELRMEMEYSRDAIAAVTGEVPYVLCYPEGYHAGQTVSVAKEYYTYGIKINGGLYHTADDPFEVNRYFISRQTDLNTFAEVCGEGENYDG